jgi:hypothetical protein
MSSHALALGLAAFAACLHAAMPVIALTPSAWKIEVLGGYTSAIVAGHRGPDDLPVGRATDQPKLSITTVIVIAVGPR